MAVQVKEFVEIINHYGWAGWAMVVGFIIWKYGGPAFSKIWDLFSKWFAPEAFERREEKRKLAAKEDQERKDQEQARKDKVESDRRMTEQAMLNRAFEMMEGTTAAQVKTAVILDNLFNVIQKGHADITDVIQQGHAERNSQYVHLSSRMTDIEIDIAPIYTHMQLERPSHLERKKQRNAGTQPNQPLPVQEVKNHGRNTQRNR